MPQVLFLVYSFRGETLGYWINSSTKWVEIEIMVLMRSEPFKRVEFMYVYKQVRNAWFSVYLISKVSYFPYRNIRKYLDINNIKGNGDTLRHSIWSCEYIFPYRFDLPKAKSSSHIWVAICLCWGWVSVKGCRSFPVRNSTYQHPGKITYNYWPHRYLRLHSPCSCHV